MTTPFSPYGENLFGEPAEPPGRGLMANEFTFPPLTVLNTNTGEWRDRRRAWLSCGIRSEVGRDVDTYGQISQWVNKNAPGFVGQADVSVFDPVLCELMYRWFCPAGGQVLDPFAGGSVRGIVAGLLGLDYLGVDLRAEQIESNMEQLQVIDPPVWPTWLVGDSHALLAADADDIPTADFVFSCPPYADLEVYSDLPDDLSLIAKSDYHAFISRYRHIIHRATNHLADDRFACFVVADLRDRRGFYRNFVSDTITAFLDNRLHLYNEAVLINSVGTNAIRAGAPFRKSRKLGKHHQNVLVFVKGDPKAATAHIEATADRGVA